MAPTGGTIAGIPVHVSDQASTNVLLVDARGIVAASEAITLKSSNAAAIEMLDVPTSTIAGGSPATPTAANLVSMFQTNSRAILAERFFGFALLRSNAVASVSGATYPGGSP
jgi:hypothetical protein